MGSLEIVAPNFMPKAFTPIELDKVRNLRYGMRALEIIEEMTGVKIGKLDMADLGIKDLKIILFAGLVHEDNKLTPDKVLELIDEYSDMATATEAMAKAMSEAFGSKNAQRTADKVNGTGS